MFLHNIDYTKLFNFLEKNTTTEQLNKVLTDHSLWGVRSVESIEWKRQYLRNSAQHQFLLKLNSVEQFRQKFVVLKGMALLAQNVFETAGDRLIGDIDILVDDLNLLHEYLIQNYNADEILNHKWKGNNFKRVYCFKYQGLEIALELHSKLFCHTGNLQYRTKILDDGLKVLRAEEMLMHLVGHLAFQHTFLKLHWLLDIQLFRRKFYSEIDMNIFEKLTHQHRFRNSWQMVESALEIIFNDKKTLNMIFNKHFLIFPEEKKWRYYYVKHLVKDSIFDILWYDLFWFLQRGWLK